MHDTTTLTVETGRLVLRGAAVGEVTVGLDLGQVAALLRHHPPTGAEIERAIDLIEDALMATGLVQVRRGSLTIADTAGPLAAASFIGALSGLGLEQVEAMFQRLAAAASGPSSVLDGVPADPMSASGLLVVRELMHHLGFDRLLRPPACSGAVPSPH